MARSTTASLPYALQKSIHLLSILICLIADRIQREMRLGNPIDSRSKPAFAMMAAMVLTGVALMLLKGLTGSPLVWEIVVVSMFPLLVGLFVSALGNRLFGAFVQTAGLIYGQGVAAFLLIAPALATSRPLRDRALDSFDRAIGFDWLQLFETTRPIDPLLTWIYGSFQWQPLPLLALLVWTRDIDRAWRLANSATLALLVTIMVAALVPALGPKAYYGLPNPGSWVPVLHYLRAGGTHLTGAMFTGLITFPSYHAVACTLFACAAFSTSLRWPYLVLNAAMLVSTLPQGSHYLADALAGIAVGAASWRIWSMRKGQPEGGVASAKAAPQTGVLPDSNP